jgi:hypothetical protein
MTGTFAEVLADLNRKAELLDCREREVHSVFAAREAAFERNTQLHFQKVKEELEAEMAERSAALAAREQACSMREQAVAREEKRVAEIKATVLAQLA